MIMRVGVIAKLPNFPNRRRIVGQHVTERRIINVVEKTESCVGVIVLRKYAEEVFCSPDSGGKMVVVFLEGIKEGLERKGRVFMTSEDVEIKCEALVGLRAAGETSSRSVVEMRNYRFLRFLSERTELCRISGHAKLIGEFCKSLEVFVQKYRTRQRNIERSDGAPVA